MNTTRLAGMIAAGALLLAACGDDGGSGAAESNEYSDAVAELLRGEGDAPFSDDEIDCFSRELVDAVGGPSAFEDAGVEPEDLAETDSLADSGFEVKDGDAEEIAGSFAECDIDLTEAFLADLGDEVPDDVKSCIEENLDEDTFADLFAQAVLSGDDADEPPPELLEDLTACIG